MLRIFSKIFKELIYLLPTALFSLRWLVRTFIGNIVNVSKRLKIINFLHSSIYIIFCSNILNLDYTVGRHEIRDFPNDKGNIRFGQTGMGMFLERFRRVLGLHPEFSNGLSDFDRSALWRSNYLLAGALTLAKV